MLIFFLGSTAGSKTDLKRGIDENKELFDFLGSAASKFGIGYVYILIIYLHVLIRY